MKEEKYNTIPVLSVHKMTGKEVYHNSITDAAIWLKHNTGTKATVPSLREGIRRTIVGSRKNYLQRKWEFIS